MDKQTHVKLILRHMEEVGPITSWQAIQLYHCTRLPARIADIKKQGTPSGARCTTRMERGGQSMVWNIPDAPYIREAEATGFDGWPRTRRKWDEWDEWWRGDDEEDDDAD